MREPNAIDFWRGFALVTIFVNHVPGNVFERFTYSHFSLSDAAELFVFLAGWSIALATRRRDGTVESGPRTVLRLASRTVEVYRAQIVITAIALAMIAASAIMLDNPLLLEWHNAGPIFAEPIQTTIGWVTLLHQLGYFNILPLYVVLLAMAPVFVLLSRVSRLAALSASFALYASCLVFEFNLPSWPIEGSWFFNPLAWQFLLVLGFVFAEWTRELPAVRAWLRRLVPLGLFGVAVGVLLVKLEIRPDPLAVPQPRLLFVLDKSYLSPGRLLHFGSVVVAFQGVYGLVEPRLPWLARQLSALGRNSLAVFCVGSIASLAGQLIRFVSGGGFMIDTFVMGWGLAILAFTAWFVEWRARLPRSP